MSGHQVIFNFKRDSGGRSPTLAPQLVNKLTRANMNASSNASKHVDALTTLLSQASARLAQARGRRPPVLKFLASDPPGGRFTRGIGTRKPL